MTGHNGRLASGKPMSGRNITRTTALLEELLNQPQRYAEPMRNFGAGAFIIVVSRQNPFAQIQRSRSHEWSILRAVQNGYSFY